MKRVIKIGCGYLCVSFVTVAVAIAGSPTGDGHARKLAAKQCASEKKAGKRVFRSVYGKHAMRNCITGTSDQVSRELKSAAKECRAERQADPGAFKERWGTNHNRRNAFGKCVSSKVREEIAENVAEFKNAAKECKAERQADRDAFKERWGTNHNRRNALGKCVSSKVRKGEN